MGTSVLDQGASAPEPEPATRRRGSGIAARRAVFRWAWRLFKREWRQQLLIIALVVVAVAVTILGAAVSTNTPPSVKAQFGTATDAASFGGADPSLVRQIGALEHRFGRVDVIENEQLPVPGSVNTYELRAQDPHGAFGQPMLALVSGHYPANPGEVDLTSGLASQLGLRVGQMFHGGGIARRIVGTVENPQSLLDEFALVVPGQVKAPTQVTALFDAPGVSAASIGRNVTTPASAANKNVINPETLSLAVLTIGMLLIALVAVGGFTVLAQRRQRSIGMLAAIGATDRHVGLVVRANGFVVGAIGAILGAVVGLAGWFAYRPRLEQDVHHEIGAFALPWTVVGLAMLLALVATYLAASQPARTLTRLPIVASLSGRPPVPRQIHRSAVPGILLMVIAFLLLGYSGSTNNGNGSGGTPELFLGIVVLIPAVILLSPFFLVVLGRIGRRSPLGIRLPLRDLVRYRARAGSALSAVSIGVMVAVIIILAAASRYSDVWDPAGPNLATSQAIIWAPTGNESVAQMQSMSPDADRVGAALGARHVVLLEQANTGLQNGSGSQQFDGTIYVATPQLLHALGIRPSEVEKGADLLTSLSGFAGASGVYLTWCAEVAPAQAKGFACTKSGIVKHTVIQGISALPSGVHAPDMLITEQAVKALGLSLTLTSPGWFAESPATISPAHIHDAQLMAAASGLSIETRNEQPTSSTVVNWATFFGIAMAFCVLAMSVGLIRSETAADLRTLAAAGASSYTRRTLTATTAGALGLLGAVLGTFAGYVALIGWLRNNSLHGGISSLANVPVGNLLVILLAMPAAAALVGWLLAGREPPMIARQPME